MGERPQISTCNEAPFSPFLTRSCTNPTASLAPIRHSVILLVWHGKFARKAIASVQRRANAAMETPTASTLTAQSDDIAIGSTDIRDANGVSHTAAASLIFVPADCGPAQETAAFCQPALQWLAAKPPRRSLVVVRGGAVHPILVERLVFASKHCLARLAHKVDQEMQVVNRQ